MKSHMKKVAYVVVFWNNLDLIEQCVESIKAQEYKNKKIILVDNNSSDETVNFIKNKYSNEVILIESCTNSGFTGGNNLGINEAMRDKDVKYVSLINSDAVLDKNWTDKLVNFISNKPRTAMVQATTLDYYNHNVVDSHYIFIARNSQATQAGWRETYDGHLTSLRVFGVNAAACLISRKFIENQPFSKKGFFDEKMFMYLEDVDVAARATVLGWANYTVPGTNAFHMGSASSSNNPAFSLFLTFRNNSAVLYKNFNYKMLMRLIPPLIKSDYHTFRHLRRLDKKKLSWVIYKARVIGILRLPLYTKDRRIMMKQVRIDNDYIWQLMKKIH